MLDDLYREVILDHYRTPRNKGPMDGSTVTIELNNPVCGDEIALHLKVEADRISDISFEGRGCSISQSSASMMTEAVIGKDVREALDIVGRFHGMMRGELDAADIDLGDLEALQGVVKFPVRIKCALLSWEALQKGISTGS